MPQPTEMCAICEVRSADRRARLSLSRKLTKDYLLVQMYENRFVEFPVCNTDYQVLLRTNNQRILAGMAFLVGVVVGCYALMMGFSALNSNVPGPKILFLLGMLIPWGIVVGSIVVAIRSNRAYNRYKKTVVAGMARAQTARAATSSQ